MVPTLATSWHSLLCNARMLRSSKFLAWIHHWKHAHVQNMMKCRIWVHGNRFITCSKRAVHVMNFARTLNPNTTRVLWGKNALYIPPQCSNYLTLRCQPFPTTTITNHGFSISSNWLTYHFTTTKGVVVHQVISKGVVVHQVISLDFEWIH